MTKFCDVCGELIGKYDSASFVCQLPKSVMCAGIEVHYTCNEKSSWVMDKTIKLHNEKHHFPVDLV